MDPKVVCGTGSRAWVFCLGLESVGTRSVPVARHERQRAARIRTLWPPPDGEGYTPQAIQVLTLVGDRIARLHCFVRPDLFGQFGPAAQAMMRAMAYDEELAARIRAALADRNRSARILQSPQRLTSDSRALPECL